MSDPLGPYRALLLGLLAVNFLAIGALMALWAAAVDRTERRFSPRFKLSLVLTGAFVWPLLPYWRGQCGKAAVAAAYGVAALFLASMVFLYKGLALSAVAALYEARALQLIAAGEKARAEPFVLGAEALAEEHARHAGRWLPGQAAKLDETVRRLKEKAR